MESNNFMIIKKENVFQKILKKLKTLFKKKEIDVIVERPNISTDSIEKEKFIDSLSVNVDFEIQSLKIKLDNGEIEAIDLTDEQIDKLQKIYDKEIAEKKLKLQNLKKSA